MLVIFSAYISSSRITDITSSVLVGQGEPAHLECAVDANPMSPKIIKWERQGYDLQSRTVSTMGAPKILLKRPKSVNTLETPQENVGVVLLTVLNATAEDSGEFWCVANNGIGGQSARNVSYLLVRRKYTKMYLYYLPISSGIL